MCIIIVLKEATKLKQDVTLEALKKSWQSNSHGAGYCFIDHDETGKPFVRIKKGYFKFKNFYKAFKYDRAKYTDSKFMIHFRFASRGAINEDNCHPFYINNHYAMAHNGTIYKFKTEKDIGDSDSKLFAEFIEKLPQEWYLNPAYVTLVKSFLGTNKVSIMSPDNMIYMFNKSEWIVENDIYYSSNYFKEERYDASKTEVLSKKEVDKLMDEYEKEVASTANSTCCLCKKPSVVKDSGEKYCLSCWEKTFNKFSNERRCRICGTILTDDEIGKCSICSVAAPNMDANVYNGGTV